MVLMHWWIDKFWADWILRKYVAAQKIVLGKYAEGCSRTQSPNEKGRQNHHLKYNFSSNHFKYGKYSDPPGLVWAELKDLLVHSGSFLKCLYHSDKLLRKSFSAAKCSDSFSSADRYDKILQGLNYSRILSSNPHFSNLT